MIIFLVLLRETAFVDQQLELLQGTLDMLIDRKSTRLNSSHLVISYAVFCLKKKIHRCAVLASYPCSTGRRIAGVRVCRNGAPARVAGGTAPYATKFGRWRSLLVRWIRSRTA